MWLRANAAENTAAAYLARLQEVDIEAELLTGVADAIRLREPQPVESLPGFASGRRVGSGCGCADRSALAVAGRPEACAGRLRGAGRQERTFAGAGR